MNIFTQIRLGLFGINNPSNYKKTFKKHISDNSFINAEELCKEYGFNYDKFAKWAEYESKTSVDEIEKYILNQICTNYALDLVNRKLIHSTSILAEHNAKTQNEINDRLSK